MCVTAIQDVHFLISSQAYDDQAVNSSMAFSHSTMQSQLSQPGAAVSSPATQQLSQSSASMSTLATQQPNFGFGLQPGQTVSNPNPHFDQYQAFSQASSIHGYQQNTAPFSNTMATPVFPGQFSSPAKQLADFSISTSLINRSPHFDQPIGPNSAWSGQNVAQPTVYGNLGNSGLGERLSIVFVSDFSYLHGFWECLGFYLQFQKKNNCLSFKCQFVIICTITCQYKLQDGFSHIFIFVYFLSFKCYVKFMWFFCFFLMHDSLGELQF